MELAIVLLISLTPLFWFQKDHVILGVDSGYAINHIKFFQFRINTWIPNPNFGVDMSSEMGLLPLISLPAIISFFGVPALYVQKVLLVGWFFTLAIVTYLFFKALFPKNNQWKIRLTGIFIYLFGFHLYPFWLQGEQAMLASYAILPLFTLFLYRFAVGKEKILKTAIFLNIAYLFFSSGGIRGVPLIAPVILTVILFVIYFSLLNWNKRGFSYILGFFYLAIVFIAILIPLNAYWILPFIDSLSHEFNTQVTIAGGIEGAISWVKFVSSHDSFLNLFRLQGDNNWYFFPFLWSNNYLTNPFLILASFIFPILAFAAPVFAKEKNDKKIILFFSILALTSLFFAAGAHAPFGTIYVFMMEHIPGFAMFRSAYYKFMPTVFFSFAILIGFTMHSLTQKMKKIIGFSISFGFLLFILAYSYPYFQNTNATFNKPFTTLVKIPSYVTDFEKMINASNIEEKTLVVPQTNTRNTIKAYTWGYYGAFSLFALLTDKPFVQYDAYLFNDSANSLISTIYNKLREGDYEGFTRAVGTTGIKYVLLTKDVAYNYKTISLEDPLIYEKILSDEKYFKKIWSSGEWILYEIQDKNIQPIINVISDTSVIRPNAKALDTYFTESGNSFILSDQLEESVLLRLGKKEELIEYFCISCVLLSVQEKPVVAHSSIQPGSLFYPIKLKRDEETFLKAVTPNQKADVALGLSLKRVSELYGLTTQVYSLEEVDRFIVPAELIFKYWVTIDRFLKKDLSYPDYTMFEKIHRYAGVSEEALRKIADTEVINSNLELSSLMFKTVSKITEVDSKLITIMNEKDWSRNFIFKVDRNQKIEDLRVSGIEQKNVSDLSYPAPIISMQMDTPTFTKVADSPYYHNKDDSILINVEIQNVPELLTQVKVETVHVPGSKKTCMVYVIDNYRWNKKYFLSVTSLADSIPKVLYVKMTKGYFKTQDTKPINQNFLNPDFTFDPTNEENTVSSFEFAGQPNDKSASVYVCTNSPFDPSLAFTNVLLREQITPYLYSFTPIPQKAKKLPYVQYKKVNATKYTVNITNAKDPYILSFLQTNSPNWRLYIDGREQKDKFMINGFANGWYIKEAGSYKITIEFYTQQAFYQGIFVTVVTFTAVLAYLFWGMLKKLAKKHI